MSKGIDHGIDTGIVAQEPCGKSPSCHMEALLVDFLPLREDRVEGLIADFRCQCAIGRTMTDKYIMYSSRQVFHAAGTDSYDGRIW